MVEFSSDFWNRPVLKNFEMAPYHSIEKVLSLFRKGFWNTNVIEADFGFHIKWTTPTIEKWREPLINATKAIKFLHTYLECPHLFSKYDIEIEHST